MCGHQVFVGFAGKDGEEVEDIEKEILVGVRHRMDESLVCRDGRLLIIRLFGCAQSIRKKTNIPLSHGTRTNCFSELHITKKERCGSKEWTRGQEKSRRVPENRGHMVSRVPKCK